MKKLTVIALVLLTFMMSINTGSAQSEAVIGTGTTLNGAFDIWSPYANFYNNNRNQYIYTAAELTAAGMTSGAEITSLGWYFDNYTDMIADGSPNNWPIQISVGSSKSANFASGTYISGLTEYYNITGWTVPKATGWSLHPFNKNGSLYKWDGTSHILVQICFGINGAGYSRSAICRHHATKGATSIVYWSDGIAACPNASGATRFDRPNVKFIYTSGGPPPPEEDDPQVACAGKTIVSPPASFLPGIYPITLRVTNPSETEDLTSFTVRWKLDGVQQPDVDVLKLIEPEQSEDIVLANFDFQYKAGFGTYKIEAEVLDPMGDPEVCDPPNEARCEDNVADPRDVSPAMAPGTYYIGGTDPHFPNLASAVAFLQASGVIGEGDINFSMRPGTYNGTTIFDGSVLSNPINFIGEGGNPSNVILEFNNDCENPSNYMFEIYNTTTMNISGCTFKVGGDCGMGGIFYFEGCNNINFTNNIFVGIQNVEAGYADDYILINIQNSNGYTFTNNKFYYNGISVNQEIDDASYCPRTISFNNNEFQGFSYQGCFLDNQSCSNSTVLFNSNKFLGQSGVSPVNGIYSENGNDAILNNTFSGFTGFIGADQAAVYIATTLTTTDSEGSAPAAVGNIIVDGNQFSQMTNVQGVRIQGAEDVSILHNDLTISFTSAGSNSRGISLDLAPNSEATIAYNDLTVLNGYVPIWMSNISSSMVDYNRFHNVDGPFGTYLTNSYNAYFANNQISSVGGQAFQCYMATAEMYHNTFSTNSNTQPTMYINYGSNITLRRNIIQNLGTSDCFRHYSNITPTMDQNSFYSGGDIAMIWNFAPVPVSYLPDNTQDIETTLMNIRNMAPDADPNDNSYYGMIALKSETDLNLNHYYREIVFTAPMFSDWRHDAFEAIDFEDMPRNGAYYMGSDNIQPEIAIVNQPIEVIDCEATENSDMIVVATATQGVELQYQWYKDGVMLPQETMYQQAVLFFEALDYDMQGIYHCIVTGAGAEPLMTDYATLYVLRPVEIKYQPGDQQIENGGTAIFELEMQVYKDEFMENHPEYMPEYQWYQATTPPTPLYDEDFNGEKYAGAQASIFTLSNVQDADKEFGYYCVVTGHCGTKTTNIVNIVGAPDFVIVAQPQENGGCEGSDIQMSIEATPSGAATDLMYHWYKDDVAIQDDANYTGTMTAVLTIAGMMPEHDGLYSVEISTVPAGNAGMSEQARVLVMAPPAIVNQPATVDVAVDERLTITIEASGFAPLDYEWMIDGTPIDYISSPTFEVEAAEEGNAGTYTCMVTNNCGEVTTTDIVVTVSTGGVLGVYNDQTPDGFVLYANQPNPVKEETTINYYAPTSAQVVITIQDMTGKEITSISEYAKQGLNPVAINTAQLGLISGSYYYTLNVNGYKVTKKMIVVK
jgi:Ig-like domain-containing protein/parallel beta helix pectate lyase-like protein/type IX secretion system substrate protein